MICGTCEGRVGVKEQLSDLPISEVSGTWIRICHQCSGNDQGIQPVCMESQDRAGIVQSSRYMEEVHWKKDSPRKDSRHLL